MDPAFRGELLKGPSSSSGTKARRSIKGCKRYYFVLHPSSSSGVARLAYYTDRKAFDSKQPAKNIITLKDCISVQDIDVDKTHFGIEITFSDRVITLFAFFESDREQWLRELRKVAFPGGRDLLDHVYAGSSPTPSPESGSFDPKMPLPPLPIDSLSLTTKAPDYGKPIVSNVTYEAGIAPAEEYRTPITMRYSEPANAFGLSGQYLLVVTSTALSLLSHGAPVATWPLKWLRRYTYKGSVFTIEAGRACETGAGEFLMQTDQPEHLFHLVDRLTKELAGTRAAAAHYDVPSKPGSHPPAKHAPLYADVPGNHTSGYVDVSSTSASDYMDMADLHSLGYVDVSAAVNPTRTQPQQTQVNQSFQSGGGHRAAENTEEVTRRQYSNGVQEDVVAYVDPSELDSPERQARDQAAATAGYDIYPTASEPVKYEAVRVVKASGEEEA
eukprot:TRINITY_DN12298_c4_g2_i2.p1 TRINITY_DN12298_c4_g2~~TRINITY_DN12298_c4_g2_i2.p1  ORF type:complete len:442 (+),score=79.78 TRINITY_DN12298_c4_g2_i2:257-1582(+)